MKIEQKTKHSYDFIEVCFCTLKACCRGIEPGKGIEISDSHSCCSGRGIVILIPILGRNHIPWNESHHQRNSQLISDKMKKDHPPPISTPTSISILPYHQHDHCRRHYCCCFSVSTITTATRCCHYWVLCIT